MVYEIKEKLRILLLGLTKTLVLNWLIIYVYDLYCKNAKVLVMFKILECYNVAKEMSRPGMFNRF